MEQKSWEADICVLPYNKYTYDKWQNYYTKLYSNCETVNYQRHDF